ncbi:unnamed protein product [Rotaria sordida]|uniref:Uncharacterized protein n=1 Tax=Rotaria sordida TaxID=392033 RepID=A0A814UJN9_9BILA|nr:unnamed protein product [Rotaria sordida]
MRNFEENIQQNLACQTVTPQTLIVYSNCSNITALNETGNGENGYFMENLLKYVTVSNMDIQTMFKRVANDIYIQTKQLKRLMLSPKNDPRDKRRPMPIPKNSPESDFLYSKLLTSKRQG